MKGNPLRTCVGCGAMYEPSGVRQQRCTSCAVEHTRKKNAEYQRQHRARHRSKEETAYQERRTWRLDANKARAEQLVADGLTPTACAERLGCSHHTVLRHLAQPEARRRVGILRRMDMPEMPH